MKPFVQNDDFYYSEHIAMDYFYLHILGALPFFMLKLYIIKNVMCSWLTRMTFITRPILLVFDIILDKTRLFLCIHAVFADRTR